MSAKAPQLELFQGASGPDNNVIQIDSKAIHPVLPPWTLNRLGMVLAAALVAVLAGALSAVLSLSGELAQTRADLQAAEETAATLEAQTDRPPPAVLQAPKHRAH